MENKIINWFEIPVSNLSRAKNFYEKILQVSLNLMEMGPVKLASFPGSEEQTGGALVEGDGYVPSQQGPIIYFNGGNDLKTILELVPEAGGKVLMTKTSIGEFGFVARFLDSEGNQIALHSIS